MKSYVALALLCLLAMPAAWAENRTTTGELIVDPPTLMALGFEWTIEGDDNRNAQVADVLSQEGRREVVAGSRPAAHAERRDLHARRARLQSAEHVLRQPASISTKTPNTK